jgi:hypothetical protein
MTDCTERQTSEGALGLAGEGHEGMTKKALS